eukprot:Seg369.4 transcript_id=Seg369.4/GoldUCD/mRNA.D3Y31 product="hypothetical protein" protein_id=Seg369.4/GoldUCD/D3Y31
MACLTQIIVRKPDIILEATSTLLSNITTINANNISKLRQLKEILLVCSAIFQENLELIKRGTDVGSDQCVIMNAKKEIDILIRNLNPEDLRKIVAFGCENADQEKVLCTIFALNQSFAKRLSSLGDFFRNHQTDQYYLQEFLDSKIYQFSSENTDNQPALSTLLQAVGFDDNGTKFIEEWLEENPMRCQQSAEYWIRVYLDEMFKNDVLLNDEIKKRYVLCNDVLGKWVGVETERYEIVTNNCDDDDDDDDQPVTIEIPIINTTLENAYSVTWNDSVINNAEAHPNLWFHATNHHSADHIRLNGINLNYGARMQDFSNSGGFYLTDSYEYALKWAKGKFTSGKLAVLVFDLDLAEMEFRGMYLKDRAVDWKQIVSLNRNNMQRSALTKTLHKEFSKADFVHGPMSINASGVCNKTWTTDFLHEEMLQLCVKSDALASKLSNNIGGIIFL